MIKPIYYNIFCSLMIALVSFYTGFYILWKKRKDKEAISFALVWLSTAFVWFCIGIYTLSLPVINKPLIKGGQIFIVFTFYAIVYHFAHKIWKGKKIGRLAVYGVSLIGLYYLILLFICSFPEPIITDWGVAFPPPLVMKYAFFAIIFIIMSLIIYDLLKRIIFWIKNKKIRDLQRFFATFSIFLYIFAGFFDEWAIHYGGIQLFLIRITEMFAVLIAYLCYSGESSENSSLLNHQQSLK